MSAAYREILQAIRLSFPQPVSDLIHDAYLVQTVARTLDQVDALKTQLPTLGVREPLDYGAAQQAQIGTEPRSLESVTEELVSYLKGMTIWGHPRTQLNVVPPPTIASLVGMMLAELYNPNLGMDDYSHRVALAEVEVIGAIASLIGYDPQESSGVFTFGGTGTELYAMKVGIEKALPGSMVNGVRSDAIIFASDRSHYCRENIAGWLGLGTKNVVLIPSSDRNEIDIEILREKARALLAAGFPIAGFICTMGTTDAFGLDNLHAVAQLRDELVSEFELNYSPHIHADAVIGWAWSVFNHYSFEENPLGFRPSTIHSLALVRKRIRDLHFADSVGIDFHKTGFTPYISSLILFKNRHDLQQLSRNRERMPYLYHYGEYNPGEYTLETSRSGAGILAALANLKLFGLQGLQALLGHLVEMTQLLREYLGANAYTTVLNHQNYGTVTLFRVYPDDVETPDITEQEFNDPAFEEVLMRHNDYNRRIEEYVHSEALAGRGVVISRTNCYRYTNYGQPVVALKSYIMSPFVDEASVKLVVDKILEARQKIAESM